MTHDSTNRSGTKQQSDDNATNFGCCFRYDDEMTEEDSDDDVFSKASTGSAPTRSNQSRSVNNNNNNNNNNNEIKMKTPTTLLLSTSPTQVSELEHQHHHQHHPKNLDKSKPSINHSEDNQEYDDVDVDVDSTTTTNASSFDSIPQLLLSSSSASTTVLSKTGSNTTTTPTTPTTPTTTTIEKTWPTLIPSMKSIRTRNPIREIVDPIVEQMRINQQQQQQQHSTGSRNHQKKTISLALGDPTAFGNLPPCSIAIQAITDAVQSSGHCTGYVEACGLFSARQAIATTCNHRNNMSYAVHDVEYSEYNSNHTITADDVIIANGCSGALEIALTAILGSNRDNNNSNNESILLVPEPGFPLYQVIAESHGASVHHYPLLANQNWEIDLKYLRSVLSKMKTTCSYAKQKNMNVVLVINNPSNPTGAVFSKQHLIDILQICNEYHIPIISDEVYGDITFGNVEDCISIFYPLAQVAIETNIPVPIITASGLAKQYLLPGWRVGWIIFHDNIYGSLKEVKKGAKRLCQLILGASHLIQSVIPKLLQPETAEAETCILNFRYNLCQTLYEQAKCLCSSLKTIPGLHVMNFPAGAMYAMVKIQIEQFDFTISNDIEFTKMLLEEEQVFVLPGSCFSSNSRTDHDEQPQRKEYYFRVVFCAPIPILQEAAYRIHNFCIRHIMSTDVNHVQRDEEGGSQKTNSKNVAEREEKNTKKKTAMRS